MKTMQVWWWRPGHTAGRRIVGLVRVSGKRKAILEITDGEALDMLERGERLMNLSIVPAKIDE